MSLGYATWQGRRKRFARRFANDFRMILPLIGLGLCLALSATGIAVTEGRIPAARHLSAIALLPNISGGDVLRSEKAVPESVDTILAPAVSALGPGGFAEIDVDAAAPGPAPARRGPKAEVPR